MNQLDFFEERTSEAVDWAPSNEAGLERLHAFLPRAGRTYASTRNYDFGPENRSNVSCLSPWIRRRLILEEDVVRKTIKHFSLSSAEKFIQEVFWRTYFKGWLEQRPGVWAQYCKDRDRLIEALGTDPTLKSNYEAAVSGKSGIDCFDAWAEELVSTGYLHNHARMWFASIWIFSLGLPWQLGADFFYRNLLDGDPASNTLSWRWVAGLHTKGKHYVARKSNVEKFTNGRFSPQSLAPDPVPLIENQEYPLLPLKNGDAMVDITDFGLLITEEDCNPESLPLTSYPTGIVGLTNKTDKSRLPTNEIVRSFSRDAVKNAVGRSGAHFDCQSLFQQSDNWGEFLTDWAIDLDVSIIITAYPPVGPTRERLDAAVPQLVQAGIKLLRIKRHYDNLCWPHANGGFFKMKKKIPTVIRELNL